MNIPIFALKIQIKLFVDIRKCYGPTLPANANVSSIYISKPNNSSGYPLGTNVTFECNTGYELSGQGIITCQADEKWSAGPTCKAGNGNVMIFTLCHNEMVEQQVSCKITGLVGWKES